VRPENVDVSVHINEWHGKVYGAEGGKNIRLATQASCHTTGEKTSNSASTKVNRNDSLWSAFIIVRERQSNARPTCCSPLRDFTKILRFKRVSKRGVALLARLSVANSYHRC
jgi:hypothetical protein